MTRRAGFGVFAVGHRAARGARRPAEQEPQRASRHVGERGRLVREQLEAEMRGVPGDRGFDVVHHVADVDRFGRHAYSWDPHPPKLRNSRRVLGPCVRKCGSGLSA